MLSVTLNDKKTFMLPQSWNELTGAQLVAIAPLLLQRELSITIRAYIAFILCGFGKAAFTAKATRKPDGYDYFANELIDQIVPRIDFLFDKNQLTAQLLPVLKVKKRFRFFGSTELYGPADDFNNLTIAEFADAEACLTQYEQTHDDIWFNRFVAVLYRPRKSKADIASPQFNGDYRQPYNFHLNDFIAAMLTGLKHSEKAAVLLWYYGCRSSFVESNAFLFRGQGSTGGGTFTDVIHSLAGPKFGTLEETGRVLLKIAAKELFLMQEAAAE